jgi:hypothetical protein
VKDLHARLDATENSATYSTQCASSHVTNLLERRIEETIVHLYSMFSISCWNSTRDVQVAIT